MRRGSVKCNPLTRCRRFCAGMGKALSQYVLPFANINRSSICFPSVEVLEVVPRRRYCRDVGGIKLRNNHVIELPVYLVVTSNPFLGVVR